MALQPVRPEDEPFLFALYASTRADEMASWGFDDAQKAVFLRMQYHAQRAQYQRLFPRAVYNIILKDQRPIGRILVSRSPGEIRLVDIALLPEYRGSGIGTRLVNDLIAEAARDRLPLRLQVQRTNSRAVVLYERLGFKAVSEQGAHLLMEILPEPSCV